MVEGPISKSFILSNSLRVADPDLLDLGVGLCRPGTASRMPVPRGRARFLYLSAMRTALKNIFILPIEKKSSRNRLATQDSRQNFLRRRATIPRERHACDLRRSRLAVVQFAGNDDWRNHRASCWLRPGSLRRTATVNFIRTRSKTPSDSPLHRTRSNAWAGVYQSSPQSCNPNEAKISLNPAIFLQDTSRNLNRDRIRRPRQMYTRRR